VPNATYRNHGIDAEAIEIVLNPDEMAYRDLLEFVFQIHGPTTPNRQDNDRGTSYRRSSTRVTSNVDGRRDNSQCQYVRLVAGPSCGNRERFPQGGI
jgi:peptide methionine sulfoxide reductase MsrA